ncbi:hypothetical protein ScPMuIL_000936 [Solemya velum]
MASVAAFVISFASGAIVRLILFRTSLPEWFASRSEITTPLTSWNRALEGVSLRRNSISPYSGDVFHETPLGLRFLDILTRMFPKHIHLVFILVDMLSGLILVWIASHFKQYMLEKQIRDLKIYAADTKKVILKSKQLRNVQIYVLLVHLFNPYGLAACLSKSTAVFDNLAILLCLFYLLKGNVIMCLSFIAVSAYQSMYPIILFVPAAIHFYKKKYPDSQSYLCGAAVWYYLQLATVLVLWLITLLGISFQLEGTWSFLQSTYGFILTVPDLTPNLGLFWYFFTEMFEHFRTFFICVFQINAVIYTVPLAVRLREHPVFFMYMLIFLIGIFKSYPSFADVALYLSLLPLWTHTFDFMRNAFVVCCMFLCCTVFAPILWHLWIYAGSANANFYFAIALTFSTAQIFLVTDLLYAFLKREFYLLHGVDQKTEDGKPVQVILD